MSKKDKKKKFKKYVKEQLKPGGILYSHLNFLTVANIINNIDEIPVVFDDDVAEIDVFGTTLYIDKGMEDSDIIKYIQEKAVEVFNNLKSPKNISRRDRIITIIVKEFTRRGYDPKVSDSRLFIDDKTSAFFLFTEPDNDVHGLPLTIVALEKEDTELAPLYLPIVESLKDDELEDSDAISNVIDTIEEFVKAGSGEDSTEEE